MRSRFGIRLMSTRWAGRASRKLSTGTSDWRPARTFASSNELRRAHASSTDVGAWYSKCGGFKLLHDRDSAAGCRFAPLESPREAAECDSLIEHLVYAPAEILDVDHVVREEQRVHDLVVGFRKDLVEPAAELPFRIFGLVRADSTDDRVHGMVRAAGVDRDPAPASL